LRVQVRCRCHKFKSYRRLIPPLMSYRRIIFSQIKSMTYDVDIEL
jgi:hypothetical protein